MLMSFVLAFRQLADPRIAAVFLKSLAVTLLLFAGLGAALWLGTRAALGHLPGTGGPGAAAVATLAMLLLAGWLLFRAIAVAVVGLFGDDVVKAVEARFYPQAPATARDLPFGRALAMGSASAARAIGVNLLFAPLYILLLATGVGTAALFFLVNAWLLGRDLGDMAAARHMRRAALPEWRARTRIGRFVLGSAAAGLFLVPVVNLVAPVLGAAAAAHYFHRGRHK